MSDISSIARSIPRTYAKSMASSITRYLRGLLMTVLLGGLQAYRLLISPLLGSRCRFHPSCSVYAQTSLQRFGPVRGGWLALRRLARCGPWHEGGFDEVPSKQCACTDDDPIIQAAVNRTRA